MKCLLVVRSLWKGCKAVLSDTRKEWSRRGEERMELKPDTMFAFCQNLCSRSVDVFPVDSSLVSLSPSLFSLPLWGYCFRMSWFQADNTFLADKQTPKQLRWYLSRTDTLHTEGNYKMGPASFVIFKKKKKLPLHLSSVHKTSEEHT